jgi:hypothetical protein
MPRRKIVAVGFLNRSLIQPEQNQKVDLKASTISPSAGGSTCVASVSVKAPGAASTPAA